MLPCWNTLTRNVRRFIVHVYHSVPYSFAICIVTTQELPGSLIRLAGTLTTMSSGHSSCRITSKPHFSPSGTDTAQLCNSLGDTERL
jgi:hypothetical protein